MNILLAFVWSPYTTAAYYAKAFRQMGHDVRTVGPCDAARWANWPEALRYRLTGPHWNYIQPWSDWKPDVAIWIEAGGGWTSPFVQCGVPTIGYFIDSHSRIDRHVKQAPLFDHVFVAQRQYVDCIPGAEWLPVACDPEVHTPTVVGEPEYDVAFVGNTYGDAPAYRTRRHILHELENRYRCNFQEYVYFKDMANVYASARVALNISTGGDLNMRVFEAMCAGRPLLTDDVPGLSELFRRPGAEVRTCIPYSGQDDLFARLDSILASPQEWCYRDIGVAGRAEVIAQHTYAHRAARMLEGL
jgi:glycosyltransferase involved in cell wall biosynthesis